MQKIMSQRGSAILTDGQKQQVLLYLKNNSRQVAQEQAATARIGTDIVLDEVLGGKHIDIAHD